MKSLLKIMFCGLIVCFFSNYVYALTVGGTAPQVHNVPIGTDAAANAAINAEFQLALQEARDDLDQFKDQPDLAKGFANANAFSAQAATIQGFQDYDLFAVTTGVMVGLKAPSLSLGYYDDIDEKIKDDGDIKAGIGTGIALLNFGLNAGFIYPGLYLNAKFGYFALNDIADKVSFKNVLVGLGANYSWLHKVSLAAGAFVWRGVSFGTGLLYNYNNTDIEIEFDDIEEDIDLSAYGIAGTSTVILNPSIELGVKSQTYSIPFDVTTSARLLWFLNFTFGLGVDLTFGSSEINIKADGSTEIIPSTSVPGVTTTPGSFYVDGGTDGKPSFIHARLISGLGFNISVVKIDFPVAYYPFEKAFGIGLTLGVVW